MANATFTFSYPTSFSTDGTITNLTIASGSNSTSGTFDNNGYMATLLTLTWSWGVAATQGINIYVLAATDDTNFQTVTDSPWGWMTVYGSTGTTRDKFVVRGDEYQKFQVYVLNNSGQSINGATLRYKQYTLVQN